MSMNCEIVLKWSATPVQLAAVGSALWRWCNRTAGAAGIYQYLDNQALADLIAGKLPDSSQTAWRADPRGVHFSFQGEASHDRQATIRGLRQEISTEGVEDIVVDGKSWNLTD
jgi:hypothetical protein